MDNTVEISLVYKEDEEFKIEKVLGEKVGEYYKVKSVPAFSNNLAFNDIIAVENDNGVLFFHDLIKPSGHSVVHIVVLNPKSSANIFAKLSSFGVGINYLHNNLYLVLDIPVKVEYIELKKFLENEADLGGLDFREACISDEHRGNLSK